MLTNTLLSTSLSIALSYLIGSLSSAIIICKLMKLPDPRTEGSNNPGATNVLRIGGKRAAMLVLLGDLLKGTIAVLLARALNAPPLILGFCALAAVLGHMYPIFFKFKGGKGVATWFGALIALSPLLFASAVIIWMGVATLTRYSSLAAITANMAIPFVAFGFHQENYIAALSILSALILWRHRANISRLWNKTETKIGEKNLKEKLEEKEI